MLPVTSRYMNATGTSVLTLDSEFRYNCATLFTYVVGCSHDPLGIEVSDSLSFREKISVLTESDNQSLQQVYITFVFNAWIT
jgi:hypothetical protein